MKETHVSTMTVQWLSTAYLLVAGRCRLPRTSSTGL